MKVIEQSDKMIKEVTIGGLKFTVEEVNNGRWTSENNGEIQYDKQQIFISDRLSKEHQEITLLHEIIHGIITQTTRDESDREVLVRCLSHGLWATGYRLVKNA